MRAGLALLLLPVLAASPAWAQGKTKAPVAPDAVGALEVCERFAAGDVLAVDDAISKGWDAYAEAGESPFVQNFTASAEIKGIGYADLFSLVEDYPGQTLGYCRIDVASPTGNGTAVIDAIAELGRYEGDVKTTDEGSFGSFTGTGDKGTLLLAHWTPQAFVIQLTMLTDKGTP